MTQAMCTSFKVELFQGLHNFQAAGGHTFKMALYTGAVVLGADTTQYDSTGEVESDGYYPGGLVMSNMNPSSFGTTAMQSFANNPTWNDVTFTASQALLYNVSTFYSGARTVVGKAVAVFDFGGSQSVVNGTFTINLPPITPTTALLRLI